MKKNILRLILIILLIGTFYRIFCFSSQDGEESSSVSQKVTVAVTQNIKKIQELEKDKKEEVLHKIEKVIRKLAHFSIYTLVGILMMALMSTYDLEPRSKIWISLAVGILYASSDEIHQYFVPDRSARVADVMIDTAGVCLGIFMVIVAIKIYRIFCKNRQKYIEN